jgi:thioredoxin-dependent peroxiredoxin
VRVFGVSFDTPEANKEFAEKSEYPFSLLCDTEREMGLAYGTCASKKSLFSARYTFVVGPTGLIEVAIDTQDPKGQAESLLPVLEGLAREDS